MNHLAKAYPALICLIFAMATPALAQQPPDLVASDSLANTAVGTNALLNVNLSESGCHNTASGEDALYSDTSGSYNTATGFSSLYSNTTGSNNTAAGYESLYFNSTGSNNTAGGYQALYSNTTGSDNTASGYQALMSNSTGSYTTAVGAGALTANTTGTNNTAIGYNSLADNTTGSQNSSFGRGTLRANTTGDGLTAAGYATLFSNTVGNSSTAFGYQALYNNTMGSNNIAVGYQAGFNVTTGSDNIEIGALGTASDNATIQIGTQGTQTKTYVAGISATQVTGAQVYVTAQGQLGVLASSERYKIDIAPIGAGSDRLGELRPVSFHLKSDPHGAVQYGLIAEEVDKVYPELVIRDEAGKVQGVRYDELAPMLVNEMQQQRHIIQGQAEQVSELGEQLAVKQQQINTSATEAIAAQAAAFQRLQEDNQQMHAELAELKRLNAAMQAAVTEIKSNGELLAKR